MLIFLCKLWRCCKFSNKNSSEQKGLCLMKLPSKVLNFFLNVIITRTFKGKNKVVRNDKKKTTWVFVFQKYDITRSISSSTNLLISKEME